MCAFFWRRKEDCLGTHSVPLNCCRLPIKHRNRQIARFLGRLPLLIPRFILPRRRSEPSLPRQVTVTLKFKSFSAKLKKEKDTKNTNSVEEKRLFLAKKNFGESYACKQTTTLASFMHFICRQTTKESSISLLSRSKTKKTGTSPVFLFWRRREDLNFRAGYPTYTLSRGASSAT